MRGLSGGQLGGCDEEVDVGEDLARELEVVLGLGFGFPMVLRV